MSAGPLLALGPIEISLDTVSQEIGNALSSVLMATGNPPSLARYVTNSILSIVYVLVLTLSSRICKLQRLILDAIPADYREDARRLGIELGTIWHTFLRGQIALALTVGVITWIPLTLMGMANAGGLALLAGLMEFLPGFGPGLSGLIGTAIALFQGSTWMPVNNVTFAVIVLIIYMVIAQIETVYLIPRLSEARYGFIRPSPSSPSSAAPSSLGCSACSWPPPSSPARARFSPTSIAS